MTVCYSQIPLSYYGLFLSETVFSYIFHCIPELRLLRVKTAPAPLDISIIKHFEHKQILAGKNRGIDEFLSLRWASPISLLTAIC